MVCVTLRVEAIAQQSELDAALPERKLAGQVISGERLVATSVLSMLVYRMRETRTAFAASMTLVWWTTRWPASLLDTSRSRVTPASAARSVSVSE
jgi:hypothetical protein